MQRLISDNIERIKSLCMTHNVASLFVFGSVCTDSFNDKRPYYMDNEIKKYLFDIKESIDSWL